LQPLERRESENRLSLDLGGNSGTATGKWSRVRAGRRETGSRGGHQSGDACGRAIGRTVTGSLQDSLEADPRAHVLGELADRPQRVVQIGHVQPVTVTTCLARRIEHVLVAAC
jgi:hypothetical protein